MPSDSPSCLDIDGNVKTAADEYFYCTPGVTEVAPPPPPLCVCAHEWTSSYLGVSGECVAQHGCPAEACDGHSSAWCYKDPESPICLGADGGLVTSEHDLFYCTPGITEVAPPPPCKFWCRLNPKSWATKCSWESCDGCEVCGSDTCKPWCSKSTTPWSRKCKWQNCDGCEVCGSDTCEPWCSKNTKPWSTKCKWQTCDGCDQCAED